MSSSTDQVDARLDSTKPGAPSLVQRLARDTVFSLLAQMKQGHLLITLPDGTSRSFGEDKGAMDARIRVLDDEFFVRCLFFADLGLAEGYLDGLCELTTIRSVISWFLLNHQNSTVLNESRRASCKINLFGLINKLRHALRSNTKLVSRRNIHDHYDLGNEFFSVFLDKSMTYSSGIYNSATASLPEAQQTKFERIARQLRLRKGDRLLEIGCGWGAFSCFAAKNFGVSVTALTISQEQYDYTKELVHKEGLDDNVDVRLQDYRDHEGVYDRIVSIEMIEAVGDEHMDVFIGKIDSLLVQDGLLVMQMITCPDSRYSTLKSNVDFIQKHIFPGSLLPSLDRVNQSMRSAGDLFLVDLFDMTQSYVRTLEDWQSTFEAGLDRIRAQGFDDRFIRKWTYYFEYCQAAFAMRNVSVVQATYSRPNNLNLNTGFGYR